MTTAHRFFFTAFTAITLISCGNKKSSEAPTGDPENTGEFIRLFPELRLPWQISDTSLVKKEKDSALIKQAIFSKFIPDSIVRKTFQKNAKLRIFPLGRVEAGNETYLFSKISTGGKHSLFVFAFDHSENLVGALSFPKPSSPGLVQTVGMDRKHSLTRTMSRRNNDGTMSEGKDVFVLNAAAKEFTLIMTESLDDKTGEIINPIDTLPRSHKYSGDYSNAKMNLVSIRDGRKSDRLSFYIHFEKNNGECSGELKGEALFRKANIAEYQQEGDPCILQFVFSKNSITLKEVQGCGARRGLQCTFDGNYPKKKVKAAPK